MDVIADIIGRILGIVVVIVMVMGFLTVVATIFKGIAGASESLKKAVSGGEMDGLTNEEKTKEILEKLFQQDKAKMEKTQRQMKERLAASKGKSNFNHPRLDKKKKKHKKGKEAYQEISLETTTIQEDAKLTMEQADFQEIEDLETMNLDFEATSMNLEEGDKMDLASRRKRDKGDSIIDFDSDTIVKSFIWKEILKRKNLF